MNDTNPDEPITNPAWLKSANGQNWLATASLHELVEHQARLIRRPTGSPDNQEIYDIIEHAIRGDEPPAAA